MNRAMRRAGWVPEELAVEALMFSALGLLNKEGEVVCPDCGGYPGERNGSGEWLFECPCGWKIGNVEI